MLHVYSLISSLSVSSQNSAGIIPNPVFQGTVNNITVNGLVENPDKRFTNIINKIVSNSLCPIPATPVTILLNPQNQTYTTPQLTYPNYKIGNYYKIPISNQLSFRGQRLPKYAADIPVPYFGFIYPQNDVDYGYVLVKTLQPLSFSADDIIIINESSVLSELNRVVKTIFAM